jgi:DNA-binding transcriptional LysR family regulator
MAWKNLKQLSLADSVPDHSSIWRFRYLLEKHDDWLEDHYVNNKVVDRAYRNTPLTPEQKKKNQRNSGTQCTVERVLGVLKLHYGMGQQCRRTHGIRHCLQRDIEDGHLVRVLPEWRTAHVHPLWTIIPHREFVPARVQAVIDMAEKVVRAATPSWALLTD